jgi:hypothetical protein
MPKTSNAPMIRIHNVETDEIIDREMNETELAQHELDGQNAIAFNAAKAKAETDKAALLARLGLTDEEAALLLL